MPVFKNIITVFGIILVVILIAGVWSFRDILFGINYH